MCMYRHKYMYKHIYMYVLDLAEVAGEEEVEGGGLLRGEEVEQLGDQLLGREECVVHRRQVQAQNLSA